MNPTHQPLVSIIIPVYQHRSFLERCLNSVASQTYANLEVVIVDDCSPDDSVALVRQLINTPQWQARFPRPTQFYPFSQNQGAHAAINHGIAQAKGEHLTILNSDDRYHPQRIERLIQTLQQHSSDLIFSQVQYIDEQDRNVTTTHPIAQSFLKTQQAIATFPSLGFACLASNVAISTGNLLFTRRLSQLVGSFANYRYCHDWDFLLRSLVYTEPIFCAEPLYDYRFHGKNSFESLKNVAVVETQKIIASYLDRVRHRTTGNAIAPSAQNWPQMFELFLHWHGFDRLPGGTLCR